MCNVSIAGNGRIVGIAGSIGGIVDFAGYDCTVGNSMKRIYCWN